MDVISGTYIAPIQLSSPKEPLILTAREQELWLLANCVDNSDSSQSLGDREQREFILYLRNNFK